MSEQLVSCYCATYGRAHCLEEAIECFLKQDYKGPKELVILNDYDQQTLVFDHPEVRIINLASRITPLGAKFNATVKNCRGNILMCWEDDDIYLPNRISYTLEHMKDGVFHTHDGFYEADPKNLIATRNVFHATHAFTRDIFEAIGGYTEKDQCSIDIELMEKIKKHINYNYTQDVNKDNIFYIYRWGSVRSYHGSGWGAIPNLSEEVKKVVENQAKVGIIPKGLVNLQPKWSYDYGRYTNAN